MKEESEKLLREVRQELAALRKQNRRLMLLFAAAMATSVALALFGAVGRAPSAAAPARSDVMLSEIQGLSDSVDDLKSTVDEVQGDVGDMKSTVDEIEGDIGPVQPDIHTDIDDAQSSLELKVDDAESSLEAYIGAPQYGDLLTDIEKKIEITCGAQR